MYVALSGVTSKNNFKFCHTTFITRKIPLPRDPISCAQLFPVALTRQLYKAPGAQLHEHSHTHSL